MWRLLVDTVPSGPDWSWISQGGSIAILATIVIGFFRGWIVPGTALTQEQERCQRAQEQLRQERDKALAQVYANSEIATRALEALERRVVP